MKGAAVYKRFWGFRDTDLLDFASEIYDSAIIDMVRSGKSIPSSPMLSDDPQFGALRFAIIKCLLGADRKIASLAKMWNMKFMAVTDLNGRNVVPTQAK